MIRLTKLINCLCNITVKNDLKHDFTLSGYITAVGKEYVLMLDQDKRERVFKRKNIKDCKLIPNNYKNELHKQKI